MEHQQRANRARIVRLSATRATLPGKIHLTFEPARLQCAKCLRENRNQRINHVHLLPVTSSERLSCTRITKNEAQKNSPRTGTDEANGTTRISQQEDQNAVCRTNDRSNDLRHETDVISLRHSEQADIPLHRDDVKIARVLNLSHATGERLSGRQKKRTLSESTPESVEDGNSDWEASPSASKLRRVGAFRLRNNERRRQLTNLSSENTTNRRFSIFPDQKFGQYEAAVLNEENSSARNVIHGQSSQRLVNAAHVRMKTKLSRPLKISTQNTTRGEDTNTNESYEISLQRCIALHGCSRLCKDCANDYLLQTSLGKSTRTRSSYFHSTISLVEDKENDYERNLHSSKTLRPSKSMKLRSRNDIGENNNVAYLTPPPSQLRVIRYKDISSASKPDAMGLLSLDGKKSVKKRRRSEIIQLQSDFEEYKPKKEPSDQSFQDDDFITLGSEAIVELLKSRQHFGSSMSMKKEKTKHRLLAAVTKARKWRKPPVKKLARASCTIAAEKKPYSPHLKRVIATPRRQFSPYRELNREKKFVLPTRNLMKSSSSSINDMASMDSSCGALSSMLESFTQENEVTNSSAQAKFLNSNTFKLWMSGRSSDIATFQQQVNGDWKRASFSGTPSSPSRKAMKRHESVDDIKSPNKRGNSLSLTDFLKVKLNAWSFRAFLQSEFSEENLDFWLECEAYKREKHSRQCKLALKIFEKYLAAQALREVNINVKIRKNIEISITTPDDDTFNEAQTHIYDLMNKDSFRRYLGSEFYRRLQNVSVNGSKKIRLSKKSTKRHIDAIVPPLKKKLRMNITEAA